MTKCAVHLNPVTPQQQLTLPARMQHKVGPSFVPPDQLQQFLWQKTHLEITASINKPPSLMLILDNG